MFSRQHYNVIAKVLRENFPSATESDIRAIMPEADDMSIIIRLGLGMAIRTTIGSIVLDFTKRFQADNESFDPLRFLDACSPDVDKWPLSELWED